MLNQLSRMFAGQASVNRKREEIDWLLSLVTSFLNKWISRDLSVWEADHVYLTQEGEEGRDGIHVGIDGSRNLILLRGVLLPADEVTGGSLKFHEISPVHAGLLSAVEQIMESQDLGDRFRTFKEMFLKEFEGELKPVVITLEDFGSSGYVAAFENEPDTRAEGLYPYQAIGSLVTDHTERLGIEVKIIG